MLRSFWFWLFFIIALFVIWMARDRITEFVETLPVEQPARTTNTQILAQTLTPRQARTATAQATSTSVQVRAATTPESGTSPRSLTEVYIIQSGDTLYSIAQRFGTDVDTLIQLNKIWDPTSLIVGEEILIPKKPTPAPTPRATQSVLEKRNDVYIVQPGDTMTSIAQKHGVSVTELVRLNNISNPNNLRVGSLIVIPTPVATSTPVRQAGAVAPSDGRVSAMNMVGPTPQPSPTPRPLYTPTPTSPPNPSACAVGTRIALVWGASFCAPDGWRLAEQPAPDRGIFLIRPEEHGETSLMAVLRPQGMPYAPLSWNLRSAKASLPAEAGLFVGGGLQEIAWGEEGSDEIAGEPALVVEATATYAQSGSRARIRLYVFNHEGQRWTVFMLAPQDKWGLYRETEFPVVLNSLRVF